MGIVDTYMIRMNPASPYLNQGEKTLFKRLRESGTISVFRCASCEACGAEVPKPKRFCCLECYKKAIVKDGKSE